MNTAPDILARVLEGMRRIPDVDAEELDAWALEHRTALVNDIRALLQRTPTRAAPPRRPRRREMPSGHVDVGEVIPLARKMTWTPGTRVTTANLADVERSDRPHKIVIKGNVLPELDLAAERERGVSAGAAWLKKKILDAVAAGPGSDDPRLRSHYVAGADWLIRSLAPLENIAQVKNFVDDWEQATRNNLVLPHVYTGAQLRAMFPPGRGSGSGRTYVYDYTEEQHEALQRAAQLRAQAYAAQDFAAAAEQSKLIDTLQRAAQIEIEHTALTTQGYAPHIKCLPEDRYQLYRKVAPPENTIGQQTVALAGVDAPTAEAIKRSRLLSLLVNPRSSFWKNDIPFARELERKGDWSKLAPAKGADERKVADEKTSGRWTRAATGQRRTGPPTGVPHDITGEQLREAFDFRGIQYGNWVEQGSRGKYLELAFEAFADLADLLGQPRAAISHQGVLALAFGARGSGAEAAHFEPRLRVINLTHTRGDGSLAHEWAHFLDHELLANPTAEKLLPGGKSVGSTASALAVPPAFRSRLAEDASSSPLNPALHPEVAASVHDVMRALHVPSPARAAELREAREAFLAAIDDKLREIRAEYGDKKVNYNDYVRRHNELASRRKNLAPSPNRTTFSADAEALGTYMWTPTEMFARAFESWAEDKLASLDRVNTYLVSGTNVYYDMARKFRDLYVGGLEPYPHGTERRDITAAVERLVRALAKHGLPPVGA
jgi:hypothetical protein